MDEWPASWVRGEQAAGQGGANSAPGGGNVPEAGDPAGAGGPPGPANDPTVQLPSGAGAGAATAGGAPVVGGAAVPGRASPWPEQPPVRSVPGRPGPGPAGRPAGGRRRRPWLRLGLACVAGLVVVLLAVVIGGYFYLDGKLNHVNALVPTANVSTGSNWLISGAPGQVTRHQERSFHIGVGQQDPNSDTIMLLHIPANSGPAVLVSIPRDSYVPIPGHGMNKINAAYSFGGPQLLVRTVQNVTGLAINHYINIGYVGLVNAVDAVGGVTLCLPHSLHDPASGVRLKKGCNTVSGKQALAFVRTRHQFATQDLQREQNQRVFIKALISKMLSTGTLLNPFAIVPAATGSVGALTVDQGTHLKDLMSVAFALRHPETTTVPVANANYLTAAGDAVKWNTRQARRLFHDLQIDHPIPQHLLTGSHLSG